MYQQFSALIINTLNLECRKLSRMKLKQTLTDENDRERYKQ